MTRLSVSTTLAPSLSCNSTAYTGIGTETASFGPSTPGAGSEISDSTSCFACWQRSSSTPRYRCLPGPSVAGRRHAKMLTPFFVDSPSATFQIPFCGSTSRRSTLTSTVPTRARSTLRVVSSPASSRTCGPRSVHAHVRGDVRDD